MNKAVDVPVIKAPKVKPSRLRLLPLTIIMAFLLLGVKVSDLYREGNKLKAMLQPDSAFAAEEEEAADGDDKEMAEKGGAEGDEAAEEGEATEGDTMQMAKLEDKDPETMKLQDRRDFSQIEIDLLQSLAERREELEERSKEIDLKEKLLDATELRINDKLTEMKTLQVEVEKLLEAYNEKEDAKIKSLVKIYESMKPKQASAIFNELDMPILLEVVDKMSERRVAPILAGMDPMRARKLTEELAEFRKLQSIPRTLGATQ